MSIYDIKPTLVFVKLDIPCLEFVLNAETSSWINIDGRSYGDHSEDCYHLQIPPC